MIGALSVQVKLYHNACSKSIKRTNNGCNSRDCPSINYIFNQYNQCYLRLLQI